MSTLQNFLQGQHIVTLTLQPMAASTSGLLSPLGFVENLILTADQISLGLSVRTVSIVPLISTRQNEVPIEQMARFSVTQILSRIEAASYSVSQPTYNQLKRTWNAVMLQQVRYAYLTFSRGNPGGQYDFIALIGSYNETGGKEKNTGRMTFAQTDIGTQNPTYVAAA